MYLCRAVILLYRPKFFGPEAHYACDNIEQKPIKLRETWHHGDWSLQAAEMLPGLFWSNTFFLSAKTPFFYSHISNSPLCMSIFT